MYRLFLCVIAAFELSLAEGNRLEKRLFHTTFATVSKRSRRRASEGMLTVQSFNVSVWVFPCRMTVKKA